MRSTEVCSSARNLPKCEISFDERKSENSRWNYSTNLRTTRKWAFAATTMTHTKFGWRLRSLLTTWVLAALATSMCGTKRRPSYSTLKNNVRISLVQQKDYTRSNVNKPSCTLVLLYNAFHLHALRRRIGRAPPWTYMVYNENNMKRLKKTEFNREETNCVPFDNPQKCIYGRLHAQCNI